MKQENESGKAHECCSKPSIVDMSYGAAVERWTNKMCLSCGKHWHGLVCIAEYTRKEWDCLMNTGMSDRPAQMVLL